MKTKNLLFCATAVLVGFTACKNEEEERAEQTVERYDAYVDSLGNIAEDDARSNWEAIEADYEQRTADAEAALANAKDREKAQERIDASKARYAEMKAKYQQQMEAEMQTQGTSGGNAKLRESLFGSQMGNDMSFAWVNKDNILQVYTDFYETFDKNQKDYSREDLDEIKTYYEALDVRKNTVEKEGLSSEDNRKIANLKLKFAPKFKWERMTSKGSENERAKDKAE